MSSLDDPPLSFLRFLLSFSLDQRREKSHRLGLDLGRPLIQSALKLLAALLLGSRARQEARGGGGGGDGGEGLYKIHNTVKGIGSKEDLLVPRGDS